MPEAVFTHTRTLVSTAMPAKAVGSPATRPAAIRGASSLDASLREACSAATAALNAMIAVHDGVAHLAPNDPARGIAYRIVNRLQPAWRDDLRQAARIPAAGASALRDKARLVNALAEFESDAADDEHPLSSLAASLAADVLKHTAQFPT